MWRGLAFFAGAALVGHLAGCARESGASTTASAPAAATRGQGTVTLTYETTADFDMKGIVSVEDLRLKEAGLRSAVVAAAGARRFTVTFPCSEELRRADDEYQEALEQFRATTLRAGEIGAALKLPASARLEAFSHILPDNHSFHLALEGLAARDDAFMAAEAALKGAPGQEPSAAALEQEDAARRALGRAYRDADGAVCSEAQVRAAIDDGKRSDLVSKYPDQCAAIERVFAAYDAWVAAGAHKTPGPEDVDRALLSSGGELGFRIAVIGADISAAAADEDALEVRDVAGPFQLDGCDVLWIPVKNADDPEFRSGELLTREQGGRRYVLCFNDADHTLLHDLPTVWIVHADTPYVDSQGWVMLPFWVDAQGAKLLHTMTGNNKGRPLAIIVNGEIVTAPRINDAISEQGEISMGGEKMGSGAPLADARRIEEAIDVGSAPTIPLRRVR